SCVSLGGKWSSPRSNLAAFRGPLILSSGFEPPCAPPAPLPSDLPSMHRNLTISVVIPCYNEEDGVRQVLSRMPKEVDEFVVVDNNCTDRTAEVARGMGARVVAEKTPGYGAAYKAGLKAATKDVVVTLDGDG